ncbi:hypothetical protein [Saccharothrix obliqua]|uniref:hypothetical protein n=1 Tax=Saccharothrix obliqua TaxID=2861747 RepID=UPI001C601B2E|nr:hypothetical protein [Saccharothrix obliqua]MBW4722397.1 hypothetical protein [Saccharothrix obliqua]
MSLTGQLHHGELGRWCETTFTGTASVVNHVRTVAAAGGPPVRPVGAVGEDHWADVGGAAGQRLADLVDPAPPYGAMLGMIRAGWLSWPQAHAQAAAYPSHARLPAPQRRRALALRRTPDGWMDLGTAEHRDPVDPHAEAVMVDLLERTRAYQAAHAPHGRWGASPGVEAGLARSAWVLGVCEGVYRSGRVDPRLASVLRAGGGVAELRALAPDTAVADLVDLAARARHARLVDKLRATGHPDGRHDLRAPLGVAAPVLVPGWADGDLLAGTPETTMLIDVKTVLTLGDPRRVARWCWQILAYAWLDTLDLHHIRSVALYLARHGTLVTWSARTLAGALLGNNNPELVARARDAFLQTATRVIRAEGGTFPIA